MEFRLLGPVQIWAEGRHFALRGPLQRGLLAALLLRANRVIAAERLVESLWQAAAPKDPIQSLQWQVWQLRRTLSRAGDADRLAFRSPGYLLRVAPGELDLEEFQRLADEGRQRLASGDAAGASRALAAAAGLWRGRALEDVELPGLCGEAERLEERRLAALEDRVEADLRRGLHRELLEELRAMEAAQPLRERFRAQLMVALYRCGRQADALAVYRDTRRALVDELGLEPGEELRRLEWAILAGDPGLAGDPALQPPGEPAAVRTAAGRSVTPAQLPADLAEFTGRAADLSWLDALLPGSPAAGPAAPVISAIAGTAGVGKTALAVHWAHRVAGRFPDGQLYVNLHGYAHGPPLQPIQALAQMLYALGVEADRIPVETERAAGLYRSLLAGRQVLIVLDNARSTEQVRPLLPGGSGCLVLVTSRDRLTGLVASHGASRLTLDVLDADEAVTLLARLLGEQRIVAEPDAAVELGRVCAFLPLALRVAAANLTSRPDQSIARFIAGLRAGDGLAGLEIHDDPEFAVRAAFDCSYAALGDDARRLFRLLGLAPGPEFSMAAAAALGAMPLARAGRLLDRLACAHLAEPRGADRFGFHDLLRSYAQQRAEDEDSEPERQAAVERLLGWYLHGADTAAELLYPQLLRLPVPAADAGLPPVGFDNAAGALRWLDAEHANLVAAVGHAAERGPSRVAWLLASALRGYLWFQRPPVEGLAVVRASLAAAVAEGDLRAQAASHLGHASRGPESYARAVEHYTSAATLARRAGWTDGRAAALTNLGIVHCRLGNLEQAAAHQSEALALYRRIGSRSGQAAALGNLALVERWLGRLRQAADRCSQALALEQRIGERDGEASSLDNLGVIHHDLGRLDLALDCLSRALTLHRETGNRYGQAQDLRGLAAVHRDAGHHTHALELAQAALALARETGDGQIEAEIRNTLGSVHLLLGRHQEAIGQHRQALGLARQSLSRSAEASALLGLAAADRHRGQHDLAIGHAQQARTIAGQAGYRVVQALAHTALAEAHLARGRHQRAADHARTAFALHRSTGHRLGQARTLMVLGRVLHHTAGADAAQSCWREAHDLLGDIGDIGRRDAGVAVETPPQLGPGR